MQTTLIEAILAQTKPVPTSQYDSGVRHSGNWPNGAEIGIDYLCVDRQFDVSANREHHALYFANKEELEEYLTAKREWVKNTDYDFTFSYSVYEWDWGPVFKYSDSF